MKDVMKNRFIQFMAIALFLLLPSYGEIKAQSPKFHYYKVNESETIVCGIVDESARTAEVVGSVKSRYTESSGGFNVSFTNSISQNVVGDLVLPSQVELRFYDGLYNIDRAAGTYVLVGIGSDSFKGCNITSVTIPPTVKYIHSDAFLNCKKLKTVKLPTNTKVSDNAFNGCDNLQAVHVVSGEGNNSSFDGILCTEGVVTFCPPAYDGCVHIPSNVKAIREGCFSNHHGITRVIIDPGISNISSEAFKDCLSLKNVTIPKSVKKVDSKAFQGCISLEQVSFEEGLAEIWDQAFMDCANLTSVIMPQTLGFLGNSAFENCSSLESVKFSERLQRIGYGSFAYCSSLKEITLPSATNYIGTNAFIGCTALEKVVLPQKVSEIDRYAFFGCRSLKSINVPKGAKYYDETFMYCNSFQSSH